MDTILRDLSPLSVAYALDANKIAFGRLLSTLPHASFYDEQCICWFETDVPNDLFNGVLQTRLKPEALPITISKILTHFQQRHLPFHWHIGPSSYPSNLRDLLAQYSISHASDEPGMAVDLFTLNENLPLASNLTIHPITTDELLHQWTQAWGCGAPTEVIQHWFTVYSGLLFGPQSSLRLYLGTIDNKPVATVELFLEAGVAAINHVVTIHQFRRQGIGAMMTLMAAREARQAGYRIGVLTASPMGIDIYRRMGFKECCLVSTCEWNPTTS